MSAFVAIVAFPLILGLVYGGIHATLSILGRPASGSGRWEVLLYPALLLIPLALTVAALAGVGPEELAAVGLAWPVTWGLPLAVAVAVHALLGAVAGAVLFANELWVSEWVARWSRRGRIVRGAMEGGEETFAGKQQVMAFPLLVLLSAFVAGAEGLLWRGYLLRFLQDHFGLAVAAALVLSALSFGLNHFYFGIKNVLLKAFSGLVWAVMVVATASLLMPVVSHFTFEVLVWRRMRRGA